MSLPVVYVDFNDSPPYGEADPSVVVGDRVLMVDFDVSLQYEATVERAGWGKGDPSRWFVEGIPDVATVSLHANEVVG